jgi:DNA replication factor GINS
VNLDELRSIQSAERESDALQHLRDGFYQEAGEYVDHLREQRREAADDAADPYGDGEVRRLTDEIETARAVTEAIWEARIGKILRVAGLAATDMSASAEGLTPEEAALFERIVEAIETNRETIQGALDTTEQPPPASNEAPPSGSNEEPPFGSNEAPPSGSNEAPPSGSNEAPPSASNHAGTVTAEQSGASVAGDPDRPTATTGDGPDEVSERSTGRPPTAAENPPDSADPSKSAPPEEPPAEEAAPATGDTSRESSPEGGRVRVRITQDVGTIAGVDGREYHLAADDVAELPDANARPLLERDAAQLLE